MSTAACPSTAVTTSPGSSPAVAAGASGRDVVDLSTRFVRSIRIDHPYPAVVDAVERSQLVGYVESESRGDEVTDGSGGCVGLPVQYPYHLAAGVDQDAAAPSHGYLAIGFNGIHEPGPVARGNGASYLLDRRKRRRRCSEPTRALIRSRDRPRARARPGTEVRRRTEAPSRCLEVLTTVTPDISSLATTLPTRCLPS